MLIDTEHKADKTDKRGTDKEGNALTFSETETD